MTARRARCSPRAAVRHHALDGAVRLGTFDPLPGATVYDSLYVTLALREGCKLATFDEKLRAQLAAKGLACVAVPP